LPIKKLVSQPSFSFVFNKNLELRLKDYINIRKNQEIAGGLIGDIKGGRKNNLIFDVKEFLPFPNLAEDPLHFASPPEYWFNILEEWRLFYHKKYKFLGFLHTHPESSPKLSNQDENFGKMLKEKYGSIILVIIGKNKYLRCYIFNENRIILISGDLHYYRLINV